MSLWAASINGHVGYSGSLPLVLLLVVIKFCSVGRSAVMALAFRQPSIDTFSMSIQ